ncbi:hypothetical protein [Streptomyces cavernicola]|uniref:Uncharacterized protein n=1 Tax=Streptomyces cavernicola TaxID=3043613 RepID=A0ABT6S7A2_9ACTN|nr:hypothetical protein [Streptomyces sp. B-S-A6]MDI3403977.1 hypothetical protein [Streptomyces sp. B-S-A6]
MTANLLASAGTDTFDIMSSPQKTVNCYRRYKPEGFTPQDGAYRNQWRLFIGVLCLSLIPALRGKAARVVPPRTPEETSAASPPKNTEFAP